MFKFPRLLIVVSGIIAWWLIYTVLLISIKAASAHSLSQLIMIGLLTPLNFLPSIIAYIRHHHNFTAITALNVIFALFAWLSMGLGGFWLMSLLWIILHWIAWFVALIWSLTKLPPVQG